MSDPAASVSYQPHNPAAEQMVLANALSFPTALEVLRPLVSAEDFADDRHGRIWQAILAMADGGTVPNVITLRAWAERDSQLEGLGGWPYLAQLAAASVTPITARDYARTVADLAMRRRVMDALERGGKRLADADPGTPTAALAGEIEAELQGIIAERVNPRRVTLAAATEQAIASAEAAHQGRTRACLTGLRAIDEATGGLYPQNLVVVAGRPGMGKTALAMTIARNVARRVNSVLVFSLEMSAEELARRLLAGASELPVQAIRRGSLGNGGWDRIVAARPALQLPITIDDTPSQQVSALRSAALAFKRRHGLALVVVDHLGKLHAPKDIAKHGPTASIGHISGELKALAKELDVPVIALCQLSRAVEGRDDKRPTMADLRQSGEIEQDADAILLLYREAYYERQRAPRREPAETLEAFQAKRQGWEIGYREIEREAEANIAKLRDGQPGMVRLDFDPLTISFDDEREGP